MGQHRGCPLQTHKIIPNFCQELTQFSPMPSIATLISRASETEFFADKKHDLRKIPTDFPIIRQSENEKLGFSIFAVHYLIVSIKPLRGGTR